MSASVSDFRVIVSCVLMMLSAPLIGQETEFVKPKVLILTTGGTIASRTDAPLIDGPELVQAVPELLDYAEIGVEEFSAIGSSRMTPTHWLALAKRLNEIFTGDSELSGVVITHGTDTMEETAYFLNLTVKTDRPVVLVGSMRSSNEISADGPGNLVNAVREAIDPQSAGQGVTVVLNENITAARDAWKTDNRRVNSFEGSGVGHIGAVDPDGVRYHHRAVQPHTTASEFDISGVDVLPNVLLLSDFSGMHESVVAKFAEQSMDGLVIRTFAGGRMSAGMAAGLANMSGKQIPTVITSRVPNGRIVSAPEYDFPAVVANGQADNKARILLMLALTRSTDLDEIQQMFNRY